MSEHLDAGRETLVQQIIQRKFRGFIDRLEEASELSPHLLIDERFALLAESQLGGMLLQPGERIGDEHIFFDYGADAVGIVNGVPVTASPNDMRMGIMKLPPGVSREPQFSGEYRIAFVFAYGSETKGAMQELAVCVTGSGDMFVEVRDALHFDGEILRENMQARDITAAELLSFTQAASRMTGVPLN